MWSRGECRGVGWGGCTASIVQPVPFSINRFQKAQAVKTTLQQQRLATKGDLKQNTPKKGFAFATKPFKQKNSGGGVEWEWCSWKWLGWWGVVGVRVGGVSFFGIGKQLF